MKCLSSFEGPCKLFPQRYVVAVLTAFGCAVMVNHRVCFSVTLTKMASIEEDYEYDEENYSYGEEVCYKEQTEYFTDEEQNKTEFNWNANEKRRIIKSYFYGYALSHVLSGVMSDMYGGKTVLLVGILVSSLSNFMLPVSARHSFWLLYCTRCIMGLGHGTVFPAVSSLCANWSPPNERSRIHSVIYSGIALGSAAGAGITAALLSLLTGWDYVFYIFGVIGLVWCLLFYFFSYNSPSQHPFVTEKERDMIEKQIAVTSGQKPKEIPWYQIFTSIPVIVYLLISVGHSWLIFLISTEMPLYFQNVLNVNVERTAIQIEFPSLAMMVSSLVTGVVCDFLSSRQIISLTNNRKIFSVLSNLMPVPFVLGASYAGCDNRTALICTTIAMIFKGFAYPSLKVNAVDLSPNYAGLLMSLANGISAVGGLFVTDVVETFVSINEGTIVEWRKTFWFSCGILFLFTMPYGFFASGEVQQFNNDFEEPNE